MIKDAFYYVDDLKIKIEQLLKSSELNSLDSHSREILKLVYKHVDSFEETAKATLPAADVQTTSMIILEVLKLRGIVAQIGSVQFSGGEEEFYDDDDDDDDAEDADDDEDDAEDDDDDDDDDAEDDDYDDDDDDDDDAEDSDADDDDDDDDYKEEEFQVAIHDVENLKQRFQSFKLRLKMEEQRSVDGLYNFFPDDEEEYDCDAQHATSKMIGACDVYKELKDNLMSDDEAVTSLVGMPGIGKTTLANKVFHDPMIVERFDHSGKTTLANKVFHERRAQISGK